MHAEAMYRTHAEVHADVEVREELPPESCLGAYQSTPKSCSRQLHKDCERVQTPFGKRVALIQAVDSSGTSWTCVSTPALPKLEDSIPFIDCLTTSIAQAGSSLSVVTWSLSCCLAYSYLTVYSFRIALICFKSMLAWSAFKTKH